MVLPWSVVLDVVFLDLLDVMVGLWIVHAFGATESQRRYGKQGVVNTYYFQAKSLDKQRTGRTSPWIQKTALVNRTGTTPLYSVENPSLGATVA